MPTVKKVREPYAGEPRVRFDVAAGGNQTEIWLTFDVSPTVGSIGAAIDPT